MPLDNLVHLVVVLLNVKYQNVSVCPINDVDQDSQILLKFLIFPESWFFFNNSENLYQRHVNHTFSWLPSQIVQL